MTKIVEEIFKKIIESNSMTGFYLVLSLIALSTIASLIPLLFFLLLREKSCRILDRDVLRKDFDATINNWIKKWEDKNIELLEISVELATFIDKNSLLLEKHTNALSHLICLNNSCKSIIMEVNKDEGIKAITDESSRKSGRLTKKRGHNTDDNK